MFQFQNPPACLAVMSPRFRLPDSRMTVMITKPMETS